MEDGNKWWKGIMAGADHSHDNGGIGPTISEDDVPDTAAMFLGNKGIFHGSLGFCDDKGSIWGKSSKQALCE